METGRHQKDPWKVANDLLNDEIRHPKVDVTAYDSSEKEFVYTCLVRPSTLRCCYYTPRHRRGA